ncbi:hypothetical protein [Streptomyces sp. NPDC054874]
MGTKTATGLGDFTPYADMATNLNRWTPRPCSLIANADVIRIT